MATAPARSALRQARRAWALLHDDPATACDLAQQALASLAQLPAGADTVGTRRASAAAWLARGFHHLYFGTTAQALPDLQAASHAFKALHDRRGELLAEAGLARAQWRSGQFSDALARVLPLRDEGLRLLVHEDRSVLLNVIGGCWSALGRADQAFAYLYQALRDTPPGRSQGFDTVLHCNLSHELLQLGDYHEALRHIGSGIGRSARMKNPRLLSVLLINRIACLTDLGRPAEALDDVRRVSAIPASADGRGPMAPHFETLAIAALRAGDVALGAELVALAGPSVRPGLPEEQVELAVAQALLAQAQRRPNSEALAPLMATEMAVQQGAPGLSLRARCLWLQTLSEVQEQQGHTPAALATLRRWQVLQQQRAEQASFSRYQAAALQTELLRMQHELDEHDARVREMAAVNAQLQKRVAEVQALQVALRAQALRDELTGLFNRRHLNESGPALLALARREQRPLSVVLIDLDHFKAVNDQQGHGVGDQLLSAFGQLLAQATRRSDVACRYGGEEFCLLLPGTDTSAARRKLTALLRRWRQTVHTLPCGGALQGLSFSAGLCDSTEGAGGLPALLKTADDALLQAKRSGRGRVLVAPASPPGEAPPAPDNAENAQVCA
ncbi:MAG: diguanylate cyclase [Rubrivivax sp.]